MFKLAPGGSQGVTIKGSPAVDDMVAVGGDGGALAECECGLRGEARPPDSCHYPNKRGASR